ncbi:MAG: helix-turn-helix domain-containing protein [Rhodospirillaceae bacterium]|nr:helix-turn-helix domain-containing protein [Rhodospirillaceae bacterium]MCA8931900.1 helix-turn-helix domain-containing protein [Rhodospirillaceae bacterium]
MPPFDMVRSMTGVGVDVHPCGACPVRPLTVCAVLDDEEISRLADIVQTVRVDAQHTIFSEGDPATNVFNVTSGTAKLYKLLPDGRRQITGFLFGGDFMGLSVNERYAYTAETVSATTICRFARRKLDTLMDEFPKLQRRLFSLASTELAAAQDQMLLLGRKTAREKIASFLIMLSQRAARRGQRDNPVGLPMGRADIADYLGLTTETVSRTFTQLKSSGVISLLENNRVDLIDRNAIHEIAEGV